MEKGEGIEIAKLYKVQAYPTLVFVDGNGQMVHKALGSREKEEFIELGKIAINPEKNLNGLGLKFKSQPSNFENAYAYIKELKEVWIYGGGGFAGELESFLQKRGIKVVGRVTRENFQSTETTGGHEL